MSRVMAGEDVSSAILEDVAFRRVAVLKAYFDESIAREMQVLTVGGFLFSLPEARRLNRGWKEIIKEYGLTSFHMTDCANGAPPYDRMGQGRRDQLIRRLIRAIRRHAQFQIAISVNVANYVECAEVISRETQIDWLSEFGGPYSFLAQMCMNGIADYCDAKASREPVAYYFEQGNQFQSETDAILNLIPYDRTMSARLRYYTHSFMPKKGKDGMRLLQAADILAWEWMRDRCEQIEQPERIRARRLSLTYLLKDSPIRVEHLRSADILQRLRGSLNFNVNVRKITNWRRYHEEAFGDLAKAVLLRKPVKASRSMT